MLIQGKPVPPELKPLSIETYKKFLLEILTSEVLFRIQQHIKETLSSWLVLNNKEKEEVLNECQGILFREFIPKPVCRTTFDRVRFSATFHPNDWSIRFSESYFRRDFAEVFKTWLHESYHALLHFLSLRLDSQDAAKIISPPQQIIFIAMQYPISERDKEAYVLAGRNLLGMTDRYMTYTEKNWAGWDSYYLNVEIIVENLTQMTMERIFSGYKFGRSYATAEDYIKRRLSGVPPIKAAVR